MILEEALEELLVVACPSNKRLQKLTVTGSTVMLEEAPADDSAVDSLLLYSESAATNCFNKQ